MLRKIIKQIKAWLRRWFTPATVEVPEWEPSEEVNPNVLWVKSQEPIILPGILPEIDQPFQFQYFGSFKAPKIKKPSPYNRKGEPYSYFLKTSWVSTRLVHRATLWNGGIWDCTYYIESKSDKSHYWTKRRLKYEMIIYPDNRYEIRNIVGDDYFTQEEWVDFKSTVEKCFKRASKKIL